VDVVSPLAVLVLVPLAAVLLVALRRRALRRSFDAAGGRPDAPLAPGELRRLRRWHHRVRRALGLVAFAYLGLVATSLVGGEPSARRAGLALGLLGAVCLLATAIQFSESCPRCGYNLGFQSRLALPAACERCGGALS
jgi:hypothetical protein